MDSAPMFGPYVPKIVSCSATGAHKVQPPHHNVQPYLQTQVQQGREKKNVPP